jgi:hypothetical protein
MITSIAYASHTPVNGTKKEMVLGQRQAFVRMLMTKAGRTRWSVELVSVVNDSLPGRRYARRVKNAKTLTSAQAIAREFVA